MNQTFTLQARLLQFLKIFFPVCIAQLAVLATAFVDTVMAGHAGTADLAGVAIAINLWLPFHSGMIGVFAGIAPILSQLHGANKKDLIPNTVVQGLYLSIVFGFGVILIGVIAIQPVLDYMQPEADVRHIAYHFLQALACGIIPLFIFGTLRNFVDSLGHTTVTMFVTLLALPLNILINYLLVFGNWGFPRMGGIGTGYASAITYWFMAILLIIIIKYRKPFADYNIFGHRRPVCLTHWREQLRLGIPIGISIACEVGIFSAVALFMTRYGTDIIAAHAAAINFSSLVYMIPLSISITATIVIGFEIGAKRYRDARHYTFLALALSLFFAVIIGLNVFVFTDKVAALYSDSRPLQLLIISFLHYAIFFILVDAFGAPAQGVLRAYKDVRFATWTAILAYWGISIPLGMLLAEQGMGPYGFWLGLIIGLAVGALALWQRIGKKTTTIMKEER